MSIMWAALPSEYRNCILRTSLRTARNFSPARKVLSITAPSETRLSLVRTNAGPLPGFTCWNSWTRKMTPSTSMWLPFLNWLVLMMAVQPFLEPNLNTVADREDDSRDEFVHGLRAKERARLRTTRKALTAEPGTSSSLCIIQAGIRRAKAHHDLASDAPERRPATSVDNAHPGPGIGDKR